MPSTYEQIDKRVAAARADKALWDDHLRECYRFIMPERNTIDKWSRGDKKDEWVFDSTAIEAAEDYASRMASEVVPNNTQWMKLESGSDVPEEGADDINGYLEKSTDILFNHINSSNFAGQIHEAFLDSCISTGAIICEEGDGIQSSLNFRCVSLSELLIERSYRGIIETVFRDITVPASDIPEIWPQADVPENIASLIQNSPQTEVALVEGVMKLKEGGYESVLLYPEKKEILHQDLLESSPWVVFRESTIPGESYGRGRGMRALRDIKTLNLMVEDHLKAASFAANPMWTAADDGVINPYTQVIAPGAIIPVGSNDNANPTLRPLVSGGDYNVLQYDIRALQGNIRNIMLSQPFGNIEETPVRTATEMSIRNADLAKSSIGASGRIQSELLERIVSRCVYILKQAGKIADFRVDGKEVKIKFTSPAARTQDEHQLAAYGRFLEFMPLLEQLQPGVTADQMKLEEFPGDIAEILGIPQSAQRTDLEKQQAAQAEAQKQQQVEQQAQANVQQEQMQ